MRFIAFDLETTGFLAGIDQIVEVGAVRFENNQPTAIFSTLINPRRSMPASASRVNGISDEMLKGKPFIEAVLPGFNEFCGSDILVAHNAPFDFQFLSADIQKFEIAAPSGVVLDTCAMARKVMPGLPNYKLGTLVDHFKIQAIEFHRAEHDAAYCGHLFAHLLEKISSEGNPDLESLIALSNNKELRFPQIVRQPKQLGFLDL